MVSSGVNGPFKVKKHSFQYISVIKVLQQFLNQVDIFSQVRNVSMNCLMNLYPNFGITKVQKLHMNTRFSHTVGQACGNNNHWQTKVGRGAKPWGGCLPLSSQHLQTLRLFPRKVKNIKHNRYFPQGLERSNPHENYPHTRETC